VFTNEKIYMLGVFVGGVLTYGIKDLVLWWLTKSKHKKYSDFSPQRDAHINNLLTEIRLGTKSIRAFVFQFHNGDKFFTGEPIQKLSVTHESVAPGISGSINHRVAIPASLMSDVLEEVVAGNGIAPKAVNEMPDHWSKHNLTNLGVGSWQAIPLYTHRSLSGFVKIHYTDPNGPTNSDTQWLIARVKQIEAMLIR
jgi:hypothetical protein